MSKVSANSISLGYREFQFFMNQGYQFLGKVMDSNRLDEIQRECTNLYLKHQPGFDEKRDWLTNALYKDIHLDSPRFREFFYENPLIDALTSIIGPNIKAASNQLSFKMSGNTQSFPWHQDNAYGQLEPSLNVTCLIALDDASEENGCLWIIPESHKYGIVPYLRMGREIHAQLTPELEEMAIPVPMKAGECLVFHGLTLHRSGPNRSEHHRRMLFMRYADADAIEINNGGRPRIGKLLRGKSRFEAVTEYRV